jgi:hypothetical protein
METKQAKYQALFEEHTNDAAYLTARDGSTLFRLIFDLGGNAAVVLKSLVHSEIDSPEERAAIRDAALAVYERIAVKIVAAIPLAVLVKDAAKTALASYLDALLSKAADATA